MLFNLDCQLSLTEFIALSKLEVIVSFKKAQRCWELTSNYSRNIRLMKMTQIFKIKGLNELYLRSLEIGRENEQLSRSIGTRIEFLKL